jgi:hypothetical protein
LEGPFHDGRILIHCIIHTAFLPRLVGVARAPMESSPRPQGAHSPTEAKRVAQPKHQSEIRDNCASPTTRSCCSSSLLTR